MRAGGKEATLFLFGAFDYFPLYEPDYFLLHARFFSLTQFLESQVNGIRNLPNQYTSHDMDSTIGVRRRQQNEQSGSISAFPFLRSGPLIQSACAKRNGL